MTRAAIPLAALALILTGCPPPKIVLPREGDTADAVLSRLEAAEAKVLRVRGEARLKAEGKEGKLLVTVFAAADAPQSVHLEQLDFFGRPQLVLQSDGRHFTLFDGQKGKWYRGPATAQAVARFFPVALAPGELAALLLGKAPRAQPSEPPALAIDRNLLKLTLASRERTDELWVSPESDRVESARLGPPLSAELSFEEWTSSNGVRAPRRIKLTRAADALELELAWKDVELNGAADASLFALTVPEGVEVIELDGRGEETALKPGAVAP